MLCPRCGTSLPSTAVSCFACGQAIPEQVLTAQAVGAPPAKPSFCSNCGRPITPPAAACPACGAPVTNMFVTYVDPLAKSKVVAGVLGILLGGFGVHRFYLGYTALGVAQIVVTTVTCGAGALWGLVEGVLILIGTGITADSTGRKLKD